jgi:hypothetical protein
MKCRQAKNLIFDHIDGMISEPDQIALEVHLNQCSECESMATGLSRSLDLLHKLPAIKPSENFNWNVRLRLLKEKNSLRDGAETERQWYRAWNTRFAVSAISALAVVLVTGAMMMKSSIQPGTAPALFELRPDAMSHVAVNKTVTPPERRIRPNAFDPNLFIGPSSVGPRSVVWGATSDHAVPMAIEDSASPVIDLDSLKTQFRRSRMEHYRVRQLEQEVEALQAELQKCDLEKK